MKSELSPTSIKQFDDGRFFLVYPEIVLKGYSTFLMVYSSQALSNKALFRYIPDGSDPKVTKVCLDIKPNNEAIILSNQNIVIANICGNNT